MAEDLKIVCMPISHNLGKHSRATPLNGSMTDRKEAKRKGIEYSIACKKIQILTVALM